MKLPPFSAIAGAGSVLTGACTLSMLIGGIYLLDCRFNLRKGDGIDQCYITGASMMGIGISGRGGYNVGFNTLNPALRKREEKSQ